jgi:hypothetical protein
MIRKPSKSWTNSKLISEHTIPAAGSTILPKYKLKRSRKQRISSIVSISPVMQQRRIVRSYRISAIILVAVLTEERLAPKPLGKALSTLRD